MVSQLTNVYILVTCGSGWSVLLMKVFLSHVSRQGTEITPSLPRCLSCFQLTAQWEKQTEEAMLEQCDKPTEQQTGSPEPSLPFLWPIPGYYFWGWDNAYGDGRGGATSLVFKTLTGSLFFWPWAVERGRDFHWKKPQVTDAEAYSIFLELSSFHWGYCFMWALYLKKACADRLGWVEFCSSCSITLFQTDSSHLIICYGLNNHRFKCLEHSRVAQFGEMVERSGA